MNLAKVKCGANLAYKRYPWLFWLAMILWVWYVISVFLIVPFEPMESFSQPLSLLPLYIFNGWDSGWYERLFFNYDTYSWPPLYPYFLRFVDAALPFQGNGFLKSAVLVNFAAYFGISYFFWRYVGLYHPQSQSQNVLFSTGLCLIFAYPGHNVLFAAYSEPLFLALSIAATFYYLEGSLFRAVLLVSLSSLTRNMGLFLCAAMVLDGLLRFVRKKFTLKQFALVCLCPVPFVLWNIYLRMVLNADMFEAQQPWIAELISNHGLSPEENPKVWVVKYLFFSYKKEVIFNWGCAGLSVLLTYKKRYVEALYVLALYASLAVHIYRPFPWTRFLSVFFPLYLIGAELLVERPKLRCLLIVTFAIISIYFQKSLFLGRVGEP